MAEKSLSDLTAEHEAEIAKLKAKQAEEALKLAPQYPKHLRVEVKDGDVNSLKDAEGKSYQIVEVKSEEEEKKALAAGKSGKPQVGSVPAESADQKLKIDERMQKEQDDKKYYGKETPEDKAREAKDDDTSTRAGRASATQRKK